MFFKKICKKFVAFILVLTLALPLLGLFGKTSVKALANGDVIEYPFATEEYALANAPKVIGQTAQATGVVQYYEQWFDGAADLSSATYLAVEYKNVVGNPGLTLGIIGGGSRFGTYADGQKVYFVNQNGKVTELSVLYASVNLGTESGMILLPLETVSRVGWDKVGGQLSSSTAFFFETNAEYNWGFQMMIGEVGYYTGNPLEGAKMTKVLDLSTQVKTDKKYTSCVELVYPETATNTTVVKYPFKAGDFAFANAPTVVGSAEPTTGDTWAWYESIFDTPKDFADVKYIGVEFQNVTGNPGLTFGVMSQGSRFGTYGNNLPGYFVKENGTYVKLTNMYDSYNLGENAKGMLLLPISAFTKIGWDTTDHQLTTATSFFINTNYKYNWNWSCKIGEIVTFSGNPFGGAVGEKVLDLSTQVKTDKVYKDSVTVNFPEKSTDTTKDPTQFVYPFAEDAMNNAPKFIGQTAKSDSNVFQFIQVSGNQVDLTNAKYFAFEYEPVQGNPGVTLGLMSDGQRFGTYTDGLPIYTVDKDGNVTELSVLYSSVNLGTEKCMVVIPLTSISLVDWGTAGTTLNKVTGIWMETNALYNWGFQFKVGELGYYNDEYLYGSVFQKTLDLTNGMNKTSVYVAEVTAEFPESSDVKTIVGMEAQYPFATGENAFNNTMVWVGTASGDTTDNWQTFRVKFDATDLTGASYVAIQYWVKTGAPGVTLGVENNGTRYSIVGSSGEEICMMGEDGSITRGCYITYDAATIQGSKGCLLLPVSLLKYQFGNAENTLAAVTNIVLTTNSRYNYAFEVAVGEVGYYTGQPCDENFTYTRLAGLNHNTPDYYYTCTSDNKDNRCTEYVYYTERSQYGDTIIGFTATGKVNGSITPWVGGAAGTQTITKDSYNDTALQLVCDGPRENADAYTAFNIFDGKKLDWSSCKGVTLWARNDSDTEISFNIEMDVLSSHTTARGRFNIKQGYRFWLYDVNTNEQTIYMTRPCVTLPVGFEGWVRIPFDAFWQADWSLADSNYGVFDRQYFMTEGSYVPYMGITVYSGNYTGKSFAVNKIGAYQTTPSFISSLVPSSATRKTILELMELAD